MERFVTGLELSVKKVDDRINHIEWKIGKVSEVAMESDSNTDNNLLKLLSTTNNVKKDFKIISEEHVQSQKQLNESNADLQNIYKSLEMKYNRLRDQLGDFS